MKKHLLAFSFLLSAFSFSLLADSPTVIVGTTSTGKRVPVRVTTGGAVETTASGGGGGGGLTDAELRATPVPVSGTPTVTRGTYTNRSGTITTGGTSQQVMASNATRNTVLIQNVSDTDQWIDFGTAAVANQPSVKLVPGASYENPANFCPTEAINIICATTGKAFTAKEN